MRRLALAIATTAVVALVGPAAAGASTPTVDVTVCGREIPAKTTGVLQQDLVCGNGTALTLDDTARLNLNGHTLELDNAVPDSGVTDVLFCVGRCMIFGGSLSANVPGESHRLIESGDVTLQNVVLQSSSDGITAQSVVATNVMMTVRQHAIAVTKRLKATYVDITSADGQDCVSSTIALSARLFLTDTALHGCSVRAWGPVVGKRLSVTNSSFDGIITASKLTLVDSTVTGNADADIVSGHKPHLVRTACGTSAQAFDQIWPTPGTTWDVCANDA